MTNENHSGRTAIHRTKLSVPMAHLLQSGLIKGEALDYGCGKGFDCDFLGMDGYDRYHRPTMVTHQYDTIICNYVLNVIPTREERQCITAHIISLLKPGGLAYISVRNDKLTEGWTSRGTWQGKVSVPHGTLVRSTPGYRMYRVDSLTATNSI